MANLRMRYGPDTCGCHLFEDEDGGFMDYKAARDSHRAMIDQQIAELEAARPDIRIKEQERHKKLKAWQTTMQRDFDRKLFELDLRAEDELMDSDIYESEVEALLASTIRLIHKNFAPQRPPRKCEAHKALGDTKDRFDAVKQENGRKNAVLILALQQKPDLNLDECRWDFDADRNLDVDFGDHLTSQAKGDVQASANSRFGVGKVKVT